MSNRGLSCLVLMLGIAPCWAQELSPTRRHLHDRLRLVVSTLKANYEQIGTIAVEGDRHDIEVDADGTRREFEAKISSLHDFRGPRYRSTAKIRPTVMPRIMFNGIEGRDADSDLVFVVTPEHFLSVNLVSRRGDLADFPDGALGDRPETLVAERRRSGETQRHMLIGGLVDLRNMLGQLETPFDRIFEMFAKSASDPKTTDSAVSNYRWEITKPGLRERFVQVMPDANGKEFARWEFELDAKSGYRVETWKEFSYGKPYRSWEYKYRDFDSGCYFPEQMTFVGYRDDGTTIRNQRVVRLTKMEVNVPVRDEDFTLEQLGLQYGDRLIDHIADQLFVYDNGRLVPAEEFVYQKPVVAEAVATKRTWWPWVVLSVVLLGGIGWQTRRLRRASKEKAK